MKIKLLFLFLSVASVVTFISSSCTKTVTNTQTLTVTDTLTVTVKDTVKITDTVKPTYPITGIWVGTYAVPGISPLYFSFAIYPDSTIITSGLGTNGSTLYTLGTWSLTGTSFSYSVTGTTVGANYGILQTGTATYDSTNGTLTSGVWQDNENNSGTFQLSRVQ